jgi:hypothetical protein
MKRLAMTATTMLLLSAAPALAMSCCSGGGKTRGAMMCGKGGMAMSHTGMKSAKGGCCCDGMVSSPRRRSRA